MLYMSTTTTTTIAASLEVSVTEKKCSKPTDGPVA